jgi:hypothetical protein
VVSGRGDRSDLVNFCTGKEIQRTLILMPTCSLYKGGSQPKSLLRGRERVLTQFCEMNSTLFLLISCLLSYACNLFFLTTQYLDLQSLTFYILVHQDHNVTATNHVRLNSMIIVHLSVSKQKTYF